MRAFNFSARSLVSSNPSYENASLAGSLAPTGNSFRPVASPQPKFITPSQARVLQPSSYPTPVPRANPVFLGNPTILQTSQSGSVPTNVTAAPQYVIAPIRGILGS